MNVVYCFDDNYARPTVVSIRSLLRWTSNAKVHLIHQCASTSSLKWMKERLPETAVFYNAGEQCWSTKNYGSHISHVSKATNLRLCIPEILPSSVHRILYLDSDTLVFADLSNYVASFPLGESGFGARPGGSMTSKTWGKCLFPRKAVPLVAGVLIMDLVQLRMLDFGNACRRIFAATGPANDQTIINFWCRGNFVPLPAEMNMRPDEASVHTNSQPRILHYEGANGKPWEADYKGPLRDLWKAHSDFAQDYFVQVSSQQQESQEETFAQSANWTSSVSHNLNSDNVTEEIIPETSFSQNFRLEIMLAAARAGAVAGTEAAARLIASTTNLSVIPFEVSIVERQQEGNPEELEPVIPHVVNQQEPEPEELEPVIPHIVNQQEPESEELEPVIPHVVNQQEPEPEELEPVIPHVVNQQEPEPLQ